MSFNRFQVVFAALSWQGTPYHHQAYVKGVGVDCIGLVRGVRRDLMGQDPLEKPDYSPAWGDVDKDERLLEAAAKYLEPVPYEGWKLGDVLVFRVKRAVSAKHCGIVVDDDKMIHSVSGRTACVTHIGAWADRVAGVFMFPGVK